MRDALRSCPHLSCHASKLYIPRAHTMGLRAVSHTCPGRSSGKYLQTKTGEKIHALRHETQQCNRDQHFFTEAGVLTQREVICTMHLAFEATVLDFNIHAISAPKCTRGWSAALVLRQLHIQVLQMHMNISSFPLTHSTSSIHGRQQPHDKRPSNADSSC